MKFQNLLLRLYRVTKTKGIYNNPLTQKLYTSSYFLYKRYYEDPFHTLVFQYPALLKHGHVIDIGANIGYNARLFSKVVTPGFQVFAFEPDKENFRQLVINCSFSASIIPINCAVGAKSGKIDFWHNDLHPGDHRIATADFKKNINIRIKTNKVSLTSIDNYTKKWKDFPISFIKIDVQGYELPVCLGMRHTLQSNPNAVIAIDFSPKDSAKLGFNPRELLSFWGNLGYTGYEMIMTGIQRENMETLYQRAISKYYINILFLHPKNKILHFM